MTKAELDYSRSLMAETNSVLAGLDSTKIHDAVNWGHVGCTAVEKVKTFSGNATLASNGACLSRKPARCLRVPHPGRRRTCQTWLFRCGSWGPQPRAGPPPRSVN
jgi:hypothetical protein